MAVAGSSLTIRRALPRTYTSRGARILFGSSCAFEKVHVHLQDRSVDFQDAVCGFAISRKRAVLRRGPLRMSCGMLLTTWAGPRHGTLFHDALPTARMVTFIPGSQVYGNSCGLGHWQRPVDASPNLFVQGHVGPATEHGADLPTEDWTSSLVAVLNLRPLKNSETGRAPTAPRLELTVSRESNAAAFGSYLCPRSVQSYFERREDGRTCLILRRDLMCQQR